MTNEELNAWERQPKVLNILTSKEFGEWLHRRDKNKEKRGKWIERCEIDGGYGATCNICGEYCALQYTDDRKFCPNCGAAMQKEVEP